jgi:hypothetical protein
VNAPKFIKLTNTYGLDVYIQPDDVKAVVPESGKGSWTQVYLYGNADHRIYVIEPAFEVIEAVTEALTPAPMPGTAFHGRELS